MNLRNLLASAAVATATLAIATAAAAAPDTSTATISGAAKIIRPISIASTGTLDFGTVVKPSAAADTDTVTIGNGASASRALTSSKAVLIGTSYSRPVITISGEGQQNYHINVPSSFNLTGPGTITVALNPNINGDQVFGGTLGGATATTPLYLGADMPITGSTASGSYSGSFDIVVNYY